MRAASSAVMTALPEVELAPRALPTSGCEGSFCAQAQAEAAEPLLPEAQRRWAARVLTERVQVLRKARHWLAEHPELLAQTVSSALVRTEADTLVSEVLPLLEAMRFLERRARRILAPQRLGSRGRPAWLLGVSATIVREPLGHILVLGPANFPIFLPGVQVLQALVAGNAVTWKPGDGGRKPALLLNHILREAGLPRGVLHVAAEGVPSAQAELAQKPAKVFLTGSQSAGRQVLATLAESVTPATMELSGADAVVVLPSADLALVAKAVSFGLRLNGAEVCMSPRRLVATRETLRALRPLLDAELAKVPARTLRPQTAERVHQALREAVEGGATLHGTFDPQAQRPLLLESATPEMTVTQSDLFAPLLSLLEAPSVMHLAGIVNRCPLKLTAAIFGAPAEATVLAAELQVGTVLINDLIAPTADPRVPFGGRGASGFGVTRGAEGLLEMTVPKTVLLRRKGITRHYEPLTRKDSPMFAGLIGLLHGGSPAKRWQALQQVIRTARARPSS